MSKEVGTEILILVVSKSPSLHGRSVIIGLQESQLYQRFTGRQQEALSKKQKDTKDGMVLNVCSI